MVAVELASARLVLPWLLGALGAPAVFTGFLVPIREAGVLLPQLAVAAYIRRLPKRKGVWLLGALLSAVVLVCMAPGMATLHGVAAGWAVIAMLTLFSLTRGLCSISAKDVLGKTVSEARRGALMGYSAAGGRDGDAADQRLHRLLRETRAGCGFLLGHAARRGRYLIDRYRGIRLNTGRAGCDRARWQRDCRRAAKSCAAA